MYTTNSSSCFIWIQSKGHSKKPSQTHLTINLCCSSSLLLHVFLLICQCFSAIAPATHRHQQPPPVPTPPPVATRTSRRHLWQLPCSILRRLRYCACGLFSAFYQPPPASFSILPLPLATTIKCYPSPNQPHEHVKRGIKILPWSWVSLSFLGFV